MGFVGDEFIGWDEFNRKRYAAGYQAPLDEYEAFSADQAWMPNVVLVAKSTYVWLEQLSKKYLRHIHRLDQIPEAFADPQTKELQKKLGELQVSAAELSVTFGPKWPMIPLAAGKFTTRRRA